MPQITLNDDGQRGGPQLHPSPTNEGITPNIVLPNAGRVYAKNFNYSS